MKKSELKNMIAESVRKHLINESFASSILKKKILGGGGLKMDSKYSNNTVGLISSLTDEDIINAALYYDKDKYETFTVALNNGDVLNILVDDERLWDAHDNYRERERNQEDTDEYGDPDEVYRGSHAGQTIDGKSWLGNDKGAAYNAAMKDFKNGMGKGEDYNDYINIRNQIRNNK